MTAHVLTVGEAHAIEAVLHAVEHVDVVLEVTPGGVTLIHPVGDVDTLGEVAALRAVASLTSSFQWAAPVARPSAPEVSR